MALVENFEDLDVWKDARQQVTKIYDITTHSKDFAFNDQIRRAAMSVMNNIAEGFERGSRKEFAHFANIAIASCGEVRSMLYLAEDLNYLEAAPAARLRDEASQLSRRLGALRKHLLTS